MVEIPAAWASSGRVKETGTPRYRIWPLSGAYTPVSSLIRVDLPAPFSPTRACTSPGASANDTSSSASTPGNRLATPTTSSIGGSGSFIAPLSRHRPVPRTARSGVPTTAGTPARSVRPGEGVLGVAAVVLAVGDDHIL